MLQNHNTSLEVIIDDLKLRELQFASKCECHLYELKKEDEYSELVNNQLRKAVDEGLAIIRDACKQSQNI